MKRLWVVLLLVGVSASFAVLGYTRGRTRNPARAEDYAHLPRPSVPPALWPAPLFALPTHAGETVSSETLAGQPYIANFIFTTCRTVCPLLTAKMVRLQRELPGAALRFVSFSVDPDHDSPAILAEYFKAWNPDEKRWVLAANTDASLQALAAGFHVTAAPTDAGLDAVMHSSVFVLVDGRGVVRGVYDSEAAEHFQSLKRDALSLLDSQIKISQPEVRSGEVLFHELSCPNCHQRDDLAPPLGGLIGQRRELDTGLVVAADEAYLRESIVAPDAKRVAGYPLKMPSYVGHLAPGELDALVHYVSQLPRTATPSSAAVAIDPVCHMQVRVTESAFTATIDGGPVHFFCSAWCRDRYRENSEAYVH